MDRQLKRTARRLVPLGLNRPTNARKICQSNHTPAAFGIGDDGFRDHVVGTALEPSQGAIGGMGPLLLQDRRLGLAKPVEIVRPRGLRLLCQTSKPVAADVAGFQRAPQQIGLIGGRQKPDGRRELRRLSARLRFGGVPEDSVRDRAGRASLVAAAPDRRPPTGLEGKFAAHYIAESARERVDDRSDPEGQVSLDEPMQTLWHRRYRVKRNGMLAGTMPEDFLGAGIDRIDRHGSATFPTDDDVIAQTETLPEIQPMTRARSHSLGIMASRVEFERTTPVGRRVFLCQLKQSVSNWSFR
jgi:hypothetical protein